MFDEENDELDGEETGCPDSSDGLHCNHWYDGGECCDCGDGAVED